MSLHKTIVRLLLQEPTTLANLQAAAQVSLPTLRKAVQELTETGWIHIVGQADANGGRPAMLYGIDDSRAILLGLHLQLPGIHMTLTDLTGEVLAEQDLFEGAVPTQSQAVSAAAEYADGLRTSHPGRRLIGIGIASPGFIDPQTGDIITIGRVPAWSNFPFCRRLQAAVGLPVHIANDIDCMAYAELELSDEPLSKSMVYIGFDEGVKASLFLNGEVYRGALGNAGLISSRLLRVDDILDVGKTGSLLSIPGIVSLFEARLQDLSQPDQEMYARVLNAPTSRSRFQMILHNAHSEMPLCRDLILDMIQVLSAAVTNLIYIIQPDVVVIGGFLSSLPRGLYDQLETAIRKRLPALISNNLIIQQGVLASQNSAAAGASLHFLHKYLADPATDLLQPGS